MTNEDTARLKEISEKFRKGLVSMAEAATLAEASIYLMMEFCRREQITAPQPNKEEMQQEMKQAQHIFQNLKTKNV